MKQADITKAVLAGEILVVGTYLNGRLDTIKIRNKQTGAMRDAHIARQLIITETDAMPVTEFLPDDVSPSDWKPGFKKGDAVVVRVKGLSMDKGTQTLNGKIESLN